MLPQSATPKHDASEKSAKIASNARDTKRKCCKSRSLHELAYLHARPYMSLLNALALKNLCNVAMRASNVHMRPSMI